MCRVPQTKERQAKRERLFLSFRLEFLIHLLASQEGKVAPDRYISCGQAAGTKTPRAANIYLVAARWLKMTVRIETKNIKWKNVAILAETTMSIIIRWRPKKKCCNLADKTLNVKI